MTVSEQIIQVVNMLCEKFGIAIDWTSENVIPYIETLCGKLVSYEIGTSIAWVAIWLVVSICSVVVTKKFTPVFKKGIEEDKQRCRYTSDWEFGAGIAITGIVIINLVTVIVICTQIMDIIKCVTFPEMFVFEYVQRIISAG
jgi:hypothetical protein